MLAAPMPLICSQEVGSFTPLLAQPRRSYCRKSASPSNVIADPPSQILFLISCNNPPLSTMCASETKRQGVRRPWEEETENPVKASEVDRVDSPSSSRAEVGPVEAGDGALPVRESETNRFDSVFAAEASWPIAANDSTISSCEIFPAETCATRCAR